MRARNNERKKSKEDESEEVLHPNPGHTSSGSVTTQGHLHLHIQ